MSKEFRNLLPLCYQCPPSLNFIGNQPHPQLLETNLAGILVVMGGTLKSVLKDIVSRYSNGAGFNILIPPDSSLGDYSTNLAFIISKKSDLSVGRTVLEIAEELSEKLNSDRKFKDVAEAKMVIPGFVNFTIKKDFLVKNLSDILDKGENFGTLDKGGGKKINLEFVSANPTGPLTVGNVRSAAYGNALANILGKAGHKVIKEYYINDYGVQVHTLGESVATGLQEINGISKELGEKMYQGQYVIDIAQEIHGKNLISAELLKDFEKLTEFCADYAVKKMIASAKTSLRRLNIKFDVWFSEKSLHQKREIEEALKLISDYVVEKDGAKWFKVGNFQPGHDDAVVIKSDGNASYLMNDIAYTKNKFERGFDLAINIWGADHHGDVPRLLAGAAALGYKDKLKILLHQLILIKEKDEKRRMSKRKGDFVLLDDFLKELSSDVIKFFFLMKDLNTHMEFDVDLAKEESNKNPVFYIQYAVARLNSIFKKSEIKNSEFNSDLLNTGEDEKLLKILIKFPDLIDDISENYQVHHLAQYALDLSAAFHNFYERQRVIQEDKNLEQARLALTRAVSIVLKNCLDILGISAPEKM